MAIKTYIVRDGFNFRVVDEKGAEKIYDAGATVEMDAEIGDNTHQLERVRKSKETDAA